MSHPGLLDMISVESVLHGSNRTGLFGVSDPSCGPNRGLNAIQRRAQQLKKWKEHEEELERIGTSNIEVKDTPSNNKKKIRTTTVRFSNDTIFTAACNNGDFEECKRLLALGTDINCVNNDGMTALHQACIDDNLEMVKFLIEQGADLDATDNDGWTPLHAASSCGHVSVTEALLDAGADPRIINNDCELASDIADTEEVEELINNKLKEFSTATLEDLRRQEIIAMTQDVAQWTRSGVVEDKPHPRTQARFLHVAAAKGYATVISTLLSNPRLRSQIDIDSLDIEKWTPLAAACYWKQAASVEVLLKFGANVDFKTVSGQSLEDLASEDTAIIELLGQHRSKMKEEIEKKMKERQQQSLHISNGKTDCDKGMFVLMSNPSYQFHFFRVCNLRT